jgi:site-specific DNA recombinase
MFHKGAFIMQTGVIYARYSCEKQTENSILGQVRECKEFAIKNDIEIIGVYKDEAISGRTATKRPSFMQMIKDGENHKFDNVIVWKGDRFSRSRADAAKYKSILKNKGIRVLSATEANITGPEAILMDGINEAFAEYFSVELAAKVERGMTQNAIDGKYNGGRMILGYKFDENRKIIIAKEEALVVKEIYKSYLERDITIPELADELNEHGYRDKIGRKLTKSTVSRILNNRRYLGIYQFKEVINTTMFPQIIDQETFDAVQNKLKSLRHRQGKGNALLQKYFLSGKLRCGECGEYFSGHSTQYREVRYSHYVCNNRRYKKGCDMQLIDKDLIEKIVASATYDFFMDGSNEEELIRNISEYNSKIRFGDIEDKKAALKKTKDRFKNIQKAIENGCGYEQFTKRLQELAEDIKLQEKEIEEEENLVKFVDPELVKEFFKYAKTVLLSNETVCETIINLLVNEVWVWKNKQMVISFKYTNKNGVCTNRNSFLCDPKFEAHQN